MNKSLILFIAALVFFSGCTQPDGGSQDVTGPVNSIMSNVDENDDISVNNAGDELVELGEPAVPLLLDSIKNENDSAKRWASNYALSNLAFESGTENREEILNDMPNYYEDDEEGVAVTAAAISVGLGDKNGIPVLIGALSSTETLPYNIHRRAVSEYSANVLRTYTGQDFGYDNSVPLSQRQTAIDQWQGWWNTNKDALTWDPNLGSNGMYVT